MVSCSWQARCPQAGEVFKDKWQQPSGDASDMKQTLFNINRSSVFPCLELWFSPYHS